MNGRQGSAGASSLFHATRQIKHFKYSLSRQVALTG